MRDWRMFIMAWALIISNFIVSLSIESLRTSLCKCWMNFLQLGGTDESRVAGYNSGGWTEGLSLGSRDSSRENSTNADKKCFLDEVLVFVVVVVVGSVVAAVVITDEHGSWLFRVDCSGAFEWLEFKLCRLLLYISEKGFGLSVCGEGYSSIDLEWSFSGDENSAILSLLQTARRFWVSIGSLFTSRGALLIDWVSWKNEPKLKKALST